MGPAMPKRLFVGVYPNAQVYCDRRRERQGDYHRIATIHFNPKGRSDLTIHDASASYGDVVVRARQDYAEMLREGFSPRLSASQPEQRVPMGGHDSTRPMPRRSAPKRGRR